MELLLHKMKWKIEKRTYCLGERFLEFKLIDIKDINRIQRVEKVEDSPLGKMMKVECKQDITDEYCKDIMQYAIDATNVECESKYIGCVLFGLEL